MEFIDVFAGSRSSDKLDIADRLGIKIAPGHYSLLVSKDRNRIKGKRRTTDFVAAEPKSKQEMNSLLTNTFYDFMIVSDFNIGKRNVRMAKRYETAVAVPLCPAMTLENSGLRRVGRNLLKVQELGGRLILCSGAAGAGDVRSGGDLAAIGVLMGVRPDLAVRAVKHTPNSILARNRKLSRNPAWGVEVLE